MAEELRFRISSGLKDIIGRDLITDEFIAVFELVKNSYDAHATRVDIYFEGSNQFENSDQKSMIRIIDNGKGMTYDDLLNKWLFVAYSAKKDGSEDVEYNYRKKINSHRPYAGAKGIGRFSCDRLGKTLYLETTSVLDPIKTESLITNWSNFEDNLKEEFINISVLHESKISNNFGHEHGTMLEISDLRSQWDVEKLRKLRRNLSKLINPSIGDKSIKFEINMHAVEIDDIDWEANLKVNGKIENNIFETLEYKTAHLQSKISGDGKLITTILKDGDTLIYKIKENNKYKLLSNVNCSLIYLNTSAKSTFTRRMGIQPINYGHVFLYKNGFRIYPFGEPGQDPLKIDQRKSQGYGRYIGTRELIGQIDIIGSSEYFKETSSRGDGFVKSLEYFQLEEFFLEALKRLEKYVVEVQRWGLSIEEEMSKEKQLKIADLITKLSGSAEMVDFEYDENIIDILGNSQINSAEALVKNLSLLASNSDNDVLKDLSERTVERLREIQKARIEAQTEAEIAIKNKQKVELDLKLISRQNQILKQAANPASVELMSIEHHINQAANRVDRNIKNILDTLLNDEINVQEIKKYLNRISLENRKMSSLINYIRKAKFDTMASSHSADLVEYIEEYIENIYKEDAVRKINKDLINDIEILKNNSNYQMEFKPLEINIILDNLLDNSLKAHANKVEIKFNIINEGKSLVIDYIDNGDGIMDNYEDKVFDFGFTTTGGSGIGLYHISEIIKYNFHGSINLMKNRKQGVHFKIIVNKNK